MKTFPASANVLAYEHHCATLAVSVQNVDLSANSKWAHAPPDANCNKVVCNSNSRNALSVRARDRHCPCAFASALSIPRKVPQQACWRLARTIIPGAHHEFTVRSCMSSSSGGCFVGSRNARRIATSTCGQWMTPLCLRRARD